MRQTALYSVTLLLLVLLVTPLAASVIRRKRDLVKLENPSVDSSEDANFDLPSIQSTEDELGAADVNEDVIEDVLLLQPEYEEQAENDEEAEEDSEAVHVPPEEDVIEDVILLQENILETVEAEVPSVLSEEEVEITEDDQEPFGEDVRMDIIDILGIPEEIVNEESSEEESVKSSKSSASKISDATRKSVSSEGSEKSIQICQKDSSNGARRLRPKINPFLATIQRSLTFRLCNGNSYGTELSKCLGSLQSILGEVECFSDAKVQKNLCKKLEPLGINFKSCKTTMKTLFGDKGCPADDCVEEPKSFKTDDRSMKKKLKFSKKLVRD